MAFPIDVLPLSVQVLGDADKFVAVGGEAPSPEASQLQVAAPERLEPVASEAPSAEASELQVAVPERLEAVAGKAPFPKVSQLQVAAPETRLCCRQSSLS